jgi:Tfp pilus assembly protein PilX
MMPERSLRANPRATTGFQKGFALVVALSLMILLTVIAVGMLTLSGISLRASAHGQALAVAKANARLALALAINELQKSSGPDQRITASAEILPASKPASLGRTRWTGVWDTSGFSPAMPEKKAFVRWLVSDDPTSPADASAATGTGDVVLFQGKDAASSVRVPKVAVKPGSASAGFYAYWVEDEGLKANLGWNEGKFTDPGPKQAARLSAVPGPDHGSLAGPFAGRTNYPITSASGNPWLGNLSKAFSAADMPLVMGDNNHQLDWLREHRHDMTLGSRGLLTDVKLGGLRRDLSLAFEMDGAADISANEQPARFNRQVGEFVGGKDRFAAPKAALGMGGVVERYLYRDTKGSGTPFSDDIVTPNSVVRGPNWWALRDYANLYKRLKGGGGNFLLNARSYYPNVSAANHPAYQWGSMSGANSGAYTWDTETLPSNGFTGTLPDRHLFKPARANYAPVFLGSVTLYSVLATNSDGKTADLAVGIDPLFYLWNPYNRTLKVDRYALKLTGFGGHITLWVSRPGASTQHGPAIITKYAQNHSNTAGWVDRLTYLASDLTMAPGEVLVLSPRSNRGADATVLRDALFPGTNTDNASGAILTSIPDSTGKNWQKIKLNLATDSVGFLYSHAFQARDAAGNITGDQGMAEHVWMDASLPAPNVKPVDLGDAAKAGEHLQQIGNNTQGTLELPEYFSPPRQAPGANISALRTGTAPANTLVNTKRFFGISTYLTKPAAHQGEMPNPVEAFTQFNPFPMGGYNDMWRPCLLSQTYSAIADPGDVDMLLQRAGINFPAAQIRSGYWGTSYAGGSTAVPLINIPSGPILSLAAFADANLTVGAMQPFRAVGNSWSSLLVSPVSPYGPVTGMPWMTATASDSSWLLNDALFDRYWLSGIAPAFMIGPSGYSSSGSLSETLTRFYSPDFRSAQANPVLRPYLPPGKSTQGIVAELAADDGYRKLGAYSLVDGVFNVNSTSVPAWTAFLRGNRDLAVDYAQGSGTNTSSGTPFPKSTAPAFSPDAATHWSGFSRLSDSQIESLAIRIVKQVKLRGPFMSLSDFVNHRVGTPKKSETHYMGALQAAIEESGINAPVKTGGGGITPVYSGAISRYFPDPPPVGSRTTTTGIPGDITQADLLLPLAPRLTARSDTFRIRAYGEALAADGTTVLAKAVCEAVVQRVPEYLDPETDPANNEPWDEANNPLQSSAKLNPINQRFGRRFNLVGFRWLAPSEI